MKSIFTLLIASLVIFASCDDDSRTKEEYEVWLEETYAELQGISESVECTNPDEWLIVEVGQNVCGESMHYLPIHESLNTLVFQKKIEGYNNTSLKYLEKWPSDVDCSQAQSVPSGIASVNGKAMLVYE